MRTKILITSSFTAGISFPKLILAQPFKISSILLLFLCQSSSLHAFTAPTKDLNQRLSARRQQEQKWRYPLRKQQDTSPRNTRTKIFHSQMKAEEDENNNGKRKDDADIDKVEASEAAANMINSINDENNNIIQTSTVKIDDHGSDLTNRFKYKVNALMGTFDPADESVDNERENGNILNAMLTFPVKYSFHVVGKTGGEASLSDGFVNEVKSVVLKESGDEEMVCTITPRGTKFTKVTIQATVDNAATITSIYKALESLELSVMQF